MSYIDEHIEYLGVHEGTKGGLKRVEDSSKSAAPYGLDNPPIDRKDKESDKAYAKRVLQYFEKEAINTLGDDYSNAPTGVKRAVLDSYYNSGKLYDGQIASLKGSDYSGFAQNTLDIVSANDPKTNSSGVLKGLANRKAATYNLMAADVGLPLITGGELADVDGKARIIYSTTEEPYTFDFQSPLHSGSKPGALNVIAPASKKKDLKPGKQSSVFTGQETKVASLDNDMVFGGSANLYANQNLPNAPQDLERVELPPDQTITPYRETIKEDVTVRPDQIRTTETIDVTAPQYSIGEQQERARRSMMQGNRQDRMEDYQYSREYQEDYPYLYPRNTGSYALPQQQAAQRMMGGGMGYAEGGSVNQAEGIASLGRGGDSTLVHMQPQEVAGLQQMAQANGTSLTTNPMTGMPEAFSLGGMFRAALPIAAGYLTGGAATPFLGAGTATASAITAGALTGAGVAAISGEDVLAGGLSGGLGGYSGMGLETALGGSAIPAGAGAGAGSTVNPALVSSSAPIASTASAGSVGSFNPALDSSLTTAGGGAAPLTQGSVFDPSINPGASPIDTMKQNLGVFETGYADDLGLNARPGEQYLKKSFVPGDNIDVAMKLGSPAVSMGLGGLEVSDFYDDDIEFSDPRDKYDPYKRLNLNQDTGIKGALAADSGLRLYAEGGKVADPGALNLNTRTQGPSGRGLNLNTGMTGVSPADLEAARLKAIKDAIPKTPAMEFVMGQGMRPVGAIEAGPLANYSRNLSGTGYTFKGKQYGMPGYAEGGPINLNSRTQGPSGRGLNLNTRTQGPSGRGLNLNTGMTGVSPADLAAAAKFKTMPNGQKVPFDFQPATQGAGNRFSGFQPSTPQSHYRDSSGNWHKGQKPQPFNAFANVSGGGIGNQYSMQNSPNYYAQGGAVKGYAEGGYLKGPGDGMSDDIPATINGEQPAALADGEFVVPADVVSHLGNGSSEAGSKQLYAMMDRIRKARTGRESQGKEIKPKKYMPR